MLESVNEFLVSVTKFLENLSTVTCSYCNKRILIEKNRYSSLVKNYTTFSISVPENKTAICDSCLEKEKYVICSLSYKIFKNGLNKINSCYGLRGINFYPKRLKLRSLESVSPEAFNDFLREHQKFLEKIDAWAGGSKRDFIPGYIILKKCGHIKSLSEHDTIDEVENDLRGAAILGEEANGYINFYWEVKHYEEKYIAGHGRAGNPYYRTNRTKKYTGTATAVVVKLKGKKNNNGDHFRSNDGSNNSNKNNRNLSLEDCIKILGLPEKFTMADIKSAYLKKISAYHPDKVSHLGEKLVRLAEQESKIINQAYAFFKKNPPR